MKRSLFPLIMLFMLIWSGAAAAQTSTPTPPPPEATPDITPEATAKVVSMIDILQPEIVATRPHNTASYTEGLVLYDGSLYESGGQYGKSNLYKTDPKTGEVLQSISLDPQYFGEGLALVDDRLIQLTWKEGKAFVYDRDTFKAKGEFNYTTGEGWGMCYDGKQLWMSDGTDTLYTRDPDTFEVTSKVQVTLGGSPVNMINELECVGDLIYANVYLTDAIIRIDKASGQITGIVDASQLLTPDERKKLQSGEVLNGIAYDAANQTFLITGKHWPKLFEVTFKVVRTVDANQ